MQYDLSQDTLLVKEYKENVSVFMEPGSSRLYSFGFQG
jgi:hypothetical protein